MILRSRAAGRRTAVAAVELAFILPFLLLILLGVWEVGRLIQVQQILNNAAREGARVASLGRIINQNKDATDILVTGSTPEVKNTVLNHMTRAGISTTGMTVSFAYTSGTVSNTQPYQATKGQRFKVTATLPFSNVRWSLLSLTNISSLSSTVEWASMIDDPFTVNTNLPNW